MTEEQVPQRGMNEEEKGLADRIYAAMQDYSINSERGIQAQEFRVGVSDLGYCSERTRRMLDQQVPEDTDMLQAFIGTAIGDHVEKAVVRRFPDAVTQAEVFLDLVGEKGNTYTLAGHPDILLREEAIVLDAKTSYGLSLARRVGADQQKRFQRHGYAKAAHAGGLFGDTPLEEVRVGNVWVDRSGVEKEVHVELEPYDEQVIVDAGRWLDDVVYAYLHGEEARKEPPREVCAATCGFFRVCREWQTDVEGLLSDDTVLSAVALYREGATMESTGRRLKKEAKAALSGVSGTTGDFTVRWVHVNESKIPETVRAAYDRLDIKPIKK